MNLASLGVSLHPGGGYLRSPTYGQELMLRRLLLVYQVSAVRQEDKAQDASLKVYYKNTRVKCRTGQNFSTMVKREPGQFVYERLIPNGETEPPHRLVTGLGVHLTFLRSFSITDELLLPSKPPLVFLSGVLAPVVRASSARAAGVRSLPSRLGVALGGAMSPRVRGFGVPASLAAFSRIDRPAFALSLSPVISRLDGSFIWNGLASTSGNGASPSRVEDKRRGVDRSVPIVIRSFMAIGPRVDGVGVGTTGT